MEKLRKIFLAIWIASALILLLLALTGCPLVEVKVVNTSIMDKGDNTKDQYSRGDDMLTDKEILDIEAELVK